jgi:hypothetical protein
LRSPGRKPSFSPASTAGRESTIFEISRARSARTAITIARNVLPVPAGPMPNVSVFVLDRVDERALTFGLRADLFAALRREQRLRVRARASRFGERLARRERHVVGRQLRAAVRRIAHAAKNLGRRGDGCGAPRNAAVAVEVDDDGHEPSSAVRLRSW